MGRSYYPPGKSQEDRAEDQEAKGSIPLFPYSQKGRGTNPEPPEPISSATEFCVLPFGILPVPRTFSRYMEAVLGLLVTAAIMTAADLVKSFM